MTKYARPLILALALLGLAASVGALYVHYRILEDPTYTSFCDINETVSCEAVLTSAYATVRGFPVALGGVIWSALVLLIAAWGMRSREKDASAAAGYIFILSTVGLSAVLYLGYASVVVIGKWCPLCMTMYVSVIGTFIVSGGVAMAMGELASRVVRDLKAIATTPVPATLAVLFLAGSAGLLAWFPRGAAVPVVADTGAVYTPPTETIEPDQLAEFNRWVDAQPRVTVPVSNGGAQVFIVKFNDYMCPSCRQTYLEYKGILAKYRNDPRVRFVTMDFPLEAECNTGGVHTASCEAAAAVRMARAKGKAEQMEEYLFANQEKMTPTWIKDAVRQVAQVTDFDAQYEAVREQVKADAALGRQLDVQATPTFFINGIKISGGFRPVFFEAVIERELKRTAPTS